MIKCGTSMCEVLWFSQVSTCKEVLDSVPPPQTCASIVHDALLWIIDITCTYMYMYCMCTHSGLGLEEEVPDYDLDSEDDEWLSAQTNERVSSPSLSLPPLSVPPSLPPSLCPLIFHSFTLSLSLYLHSLSLPPTLSVWWTSWKRVVATQYCQRGRLSFSSETTKT